MTRPDARPIAVIHLYAGPNSRPDSPKYVVFIQAAGLTRLSPSSDSADPWRTADAALNHAAKVIIEHERRQMPSSTPDLVAHDYSFETGERP